MKLPVEAPALSCWPTVPGARFDDETIESRNAFYGVGGNGLEAMTGLENAAVHRGPWGESYTASLAVNWSPAHRFSQGSARASLHCAEGLVEIWVSRGAGLAASGLFLEQLPVDLPESLRLAVVEEALGGLLRQWAHAHGLCVLAIEAEPWAGDLTPDQQRILAFCKVDNPGVPSGVRFAVRTASFEVKSRLACISPPCNHLMSYHVRWAVRSPAIRLGLSDAMALRPGDGIELCALIRDGLPMVLVSASGRRPPALLTWRNDQMTIESLEEANLVQPATALQASTDGEDASAAGEAAGVSDLGLRLSVEVARLEVTVGEVARWRPGHVLDLKLPLDNTRVTLRIDDRVVGQGQMVILGDRLAVEVTQWTPGARETHAV